MTEMMMLLHFLSLISWVFFRFYKSLKKVWKRVNIEIDIRFHYKKK